ncbi:MAG: two-component system, OmpR family, phosphate regulon sensor histidine kinase PhoR [Acidobacteriota bacterium]|nr:two-component system, OmpR family, phosphate regulon sensor histidine kinase PhoR [Acidobacteriota bacterium]
MSFRHTLAAALCLAIVASFIALYFAQPILCAIAVVFAIAGCLTATLLRRDATHNQSLKKTDAHAGIGPALVSRGALAGSAGDGIPAGEMLEAMLGSVREGLVVVDGGMRVIALNASARAIFGAGEGDVASSSTHTHEDACDALQEGQLRALGELTRNPAVLGAFAEALAHGRQVGAKIETDVRERRAYDLRVAPLKPREGWGARRGAVGIFFDITRLERLERVRQEFLLNVSHELRTPLTAIRAFVETLAAGVVDEPENNRRFLSIIDRNAARMQSLIDDILELSSIEAGRVSVEPQPVRLRALVQDVLTSLAGRAAERGVALHNEVAEDVTVRADARRLEQMLTNLTDNAVKFNREHGEVRVAHARGPERDRINVSDTGEGIAPEHLARIFERFYRVDRARSRAMGGTGLGLAIVKHLARAHGGEATVNSTVGEGTVFTLELPRGESDEVGTLNDEARMKR